MLHTQSSRARQHIFTINQIFFRFVLRSLLLRPICPASACTVSSSESWRWAHGTSVHIVYDIRLKVSMWRQYTINTKCDTVNLTSYMSSVESRRCQLCSSGVFFVYRTDRAPRWRRRQQQTAGMSKQQRRPNNWKRKKLSLRVITKSCQCVAGARLCVSFIDWPHFPVSACTCACVCQLVPFALNIFPSCDFAKSIIIIFSVKSKR